MLKINLDRRIDKVSTVRLKGSIFIFIICVASLSCDRVKERKVADHRQPLIEYLKDTFRISPDAKQFDSIYLVRLKTENKSLEIDSLISSHLSIVRYAPLTLDFAAYFPRYRYKDREKTEHFAINFIRNYKTGKIYFDFIDWNAGFIIEDYCAYSQINMGNVEGIPKDDIKVYSSIQSNRRFADWEVSPGSNKAGIQEFLNSEFRFKKISKLELDSLFAFYGNTAHYGQLEDSLVKDPADLLHFFANQVNHIKERNYHTIEDLVYLKDQINFLLARYNQCDSSNNFQWIYKSDHRLYERMVSIKSAQNKFFTYFLEEKSFCF